MKCPHCNNEVDKPENNNRIFGIPPDKLWSFTVCRFCGYRKKNGKVTLKNESTKSKSDDSRGNGKEGFIVS